MVKVDNLTNVQEFILEGFPAVQHLGKPLFIVHLLLYLVAIMGSIVIVTITWADRCLQTPMYFFLSNFSFLESCFITTVIPKLLAIFLSGMQKISFAACLTQSFFFLFLGSTCFFLLAVMSLDRYMAICNPLRYHSIMNMRVCFLLVLSCYVLGFILIIGPILMVSQLSFCDFNVINHFFYDLGPLVHLSCSDTSTVESLFFCLSVVIILSSLTITVISYINIITIIVNFPSAKERQKAFSTCSSHLLVLFLTYGSCVFIYVKPKQADRLEDNKEAALVNTVITPLLNPFIYTLRNKQVKKALRDALYRMKSMRQSQF
ncbi:olfactory receptor 6C4-like [Trichosurus vulpecula]|uniref:olfactory receptor 6C4-like n=1 Tax=Trichosurus vulpecula TaxID=9337 RepID=UPI00186B0A4F|nr:olfactory receptor 6C4-like [Trichosurus vulpecula]